MKLTNLILKTSMFYILFIGYVSAQSISGVVSSDDGPLPGVSIVEKGTSNGTTTDIDGQYSINVSEGATLVYSFVGYSSQEMSTAGKSNIDVFLAEGLQLENVVVIGSRNPERTSTESPVPVDVLDVREIVKQAPQVNLNQILNYVAPSFTSNTQTISDGTDHIDPASLRGLGPDQVLVLINGKRRHTTSLVNVNGTFGRGNVGTDLNAIPAASIERIEILRDGAAAQYGSDAIAGVINIVLKKSVNNLSVAVQTGAHMSENSNKQTGGMDGETVNVSANFGIPVGDKGGYVNFTGDFDVRNDYNRMKEWEGSIFNAYNAIERVANADGFDISKLPSDLDAIQRYGAQVSHFSSELKSDIAGATTLDQLTRPIGSGDDAVDPVLQANVTDAELSARGQERSDYNMRVGQSALRGGRFFVNMALPLDDNGTEFYSFAGLSARGGNSAGFYRLPNQSRAYTPIFINGFLPEINSKIKDESLAVGIRGKVKNWNIDFSNTFGKNSFLYEISNTLNASLQNASPTRFDAGGFSFTQNTTNVDISRFYDNVFQGLNVALGTEYRFERYEIVAGEEGSYRQYQADGSPVLLSTDSPARDIFGRSRPGGSQVFPGFQPANELSRERTSIGGYLDLEADINESFLLSAATRYEEYSDFGSTLNFKGATRIKVGDFLNIRASASTGFRAPSLHQLNFNSTSTIFVDGVPQEVGTFSNDSKVAELLGIPKLKQETSVGLTVGFTAKLPYNFTVTVDAYQIDIDDRIVYTGQFSPGDNAELQRLFSLANASRAAFFSNAIDTRSQGMDIVISHQFRNENFSLKNDFAATFSKTEQVGDIQSSDVIKSAGLESTYFDEISRIYLEGAVPLTKANLSHSLNVGLFTFFLRNVYFGPVFEATSTVANQQEFAAKVVTDLSVTVNLSPVSLSVGANNLFDIFPDRNIEANRSSGRFDWSRRSQQFGIGGRFVFGKISLSI